MLKLEFPQKTVHAIQTTEKYKQVFVVRDNPNLSTRTPLIPAFHVFKKCHFQDLIKLKHLVSSKLGNNTNKTNNEHGSSKGGNLLNIMVFTF